MRFAASPNAPSEEFFQMTSMVDVVFILLAFFVLSARFLGQEHDVTVSHESPSSSIAAAEDLPSAIVLRLTRNDAGGAAMTLEGARLPDDQFPAITAKLDEINVPTMTVVVAAEATLTVDQVASAVDAVLASPMKKVSLTRWPLRNTDE